MRITVKSGSVVTLPLGDVADVASNNSAVGVTAAPQGGIILAAAQPGTAEVTVKFGLFFHVTIYVTVV